MRVRATCRDLLVWNNLDLQVSRCAQSDWCSIETVSVSQSVSRSERLGADKNEEVLTGAVQRSRPRSTSHNRESPGVRAVCRLYMEGDPIGPDETRAWCMEHPNHVMRVRDGTELGLHIDTRRTNFPTRGKY